MKVRDAHAHCFQFAQRMGRAPHRKNECFVPSIRLNGKWLTALGFVSGQKIRVITNGAIITLAPVGFDSELRHYGK